MRRVLLGTTALVAAGLLVTSVAYADEEEMMEEQPVTVGISGYSTGIVGINSTDTVTKHKAGVATTHPARGEEVFHVFEFAISGSTTLDNGITVAVHTQLGSSSEKGTDFDEQHITMSGSFGALRIGRTESAAFNATVGAPGGSGIGVGVNYPWYSPAASAVNTYSGLGAEDAQKVVYTSPNFNGLTVGMSYAPEGGVAGAGAGRTTDDTSLNDKTGDMDGQLSEHAALGVSYSTGFMEGGSLSIGLGYEMATDEGGGPDMEAMKAGASVSVDQVSFGGGMYEATPDGGSSSMQYDVGASWAQGAMEVGVQYAANDDGGTGMAALNLTYTLGPGVVLGGQVAAGSSDGAEDVTQVLLGTSVSF